MKSCNFYRGFYFSARTLQVHLGDSIDDLIFVFVSAMVQLWSIPQGPYVKNLGSQGGAMRDRAQLGRDSLGLWVWDLEQVCGPPASFPFASRL